MECRLCGGYSNHIKIQLNDKIKGECKYFFGKSRPEFNFHSLIIFFLD